MFNKIFHFIKRSSNKRKCTLKQEKGISLVEVIVAIVIISIITVVLINGTIMAVNVSKMNRAKTLSSANGGTYANPNAAVMLIANNEVKTSTGTFLRGGTVSNSLVLGINTEIYYETGIGEYLTAGVPGFGETMITTMSWQEIIAD